MFSFLQENLYLISILCIVSFFCLIIFCGIVVALNESKSSFDKNDSPLTICVIALLAIGFVLFALFLWATDIYASIK